MFEISAAPIDTERLARELANPRAGALVAFEGWVRNHHDGNPVQHLEYDAFEEMARTIGNAILEEAKKRFGILAARVAHRVGTLSIGARAIWVGVTAEHRQEAFLACRWIMDRIKKDVPVWKMETYRDNREPAWVHADMGSASTDADSSAPRPDAAFPDLGKEERRKLAEARVLVIGTGVSGCPALQYLAAAGVGMLTIVDGDRVEESRLHREILFGIPDIGRNKAEAAADRLRALNPQLAVRSVPAAATPGKLAGLLAGQDAVLDGSDSCESRYAIHDACRESGIVRIQAGINGEDGFVHAIDPAGRFGGKIETQIEAMLRL